MSAMIYTLYGFAIFFFIFWSGKWVIHILALTYGKYKLHKKTSALPREVPYPSVSILKPLMGVDPNLHSNLESFFAMDFPQYELLFCIEDANDPAILVVNRLMEKYPNVDARLFIGGSNVGVNPKINNMNPGYLAAKYELVMISDSGIRMKEDTLRDMVNHMTDKIALCHQLPFTADREGFAATFEKIFFGTMHARIYLVSNLLGINCHTGMSSLMRKSVIDQLGGLQSFGCYLAEDFFIAKKVVDSGWKIDISSQPALQNSGLCDISSFQSRLTRWAKLRVAMVPTLILLEPMAECLVVGLLAAWSVSVLFRWDSLVFYLIHILVWFLSDWIMLSIVQNGTLPFNKFDFVVGWLFREISGPYLLYHALRYPEITWRTRSYKLAWGGVAYEMPPSKNNSKIICLGGSGSCSTILTSPTKKFQLSSDDVTDSEVHLILEDMEMSDIINHDGDVTTITTTMNSSSNNHHHHHNNPQNSVLRLQSFPQQYQYHQNHLHHHHYNSNNNNNKNNANSNNSSSVAITKLHNGSSSSSSNNNNNQGGQGSKLMNAFIANSSFSSSLNMPKIKS